MLLDHGLERSSICMLACKPSNWVLERLLRTVGYQTQRPESVDKIKKRGTSPGSSFETLALERVLERLSDKTKRKSAISRNH